MTKKQPQTVLIPRYKFNNQRGIRSLHLASDVVHDFDGYYSIKDSVYLHTTEELEALKAECCIGLLEWMNNVTQENPMMLETDHDDIVAMYLHSLPESPKP